MKNIIIILSTGLVLYGAHGDASFDGDQIPGVVQDGESHLPLPKEHVFSRQVSRNAFPDSDVEESTSSRGSVLVDLPHIGEAVSKKTPEPKKDESCCVLL